MAARWNQKRYDEWVENTHIPEDVMVIVNAVCKKIGMHVEEDVVEVRNVWDVLVGFAKGFRITHCTSSYESGPTKDMTPTFLAWLGGLGFSECASYGIMESVRACLNLIDRKGLKNDYRNQLDIVDQNGDLYNVITGVKIKY